MTIFSCLTIEHNLSRVIKQIKYFNVINHKNVTIKRNFGNMSKKLDSSKTYVSIKIPQDDKTGRFLKLFRKRPTTLSNSGENVRKTEWSRLFSLAKPEKWNLMG